MVYIDEYLYDVFYINFFKQKISYNKIEKVKHYVTDHNHLIINREKNITIYTKFFVKTCVSYTKL